MKASWSHTHKATVAPPPIPSTCGVAECEVADIALCDYVDKRGRHCSTVWCAQHSVLVEGRTYCRRHANTLAALSGEEVVAGIPDLDNRAPALVRWVSREVKDAISEMLWAISPGETVLVADSVRLHLAKTGVDHRPIRRWASTWKLMDHASVLCSVAIEVDEEEPTEIRARVDGREVGHGVPPWITRRPTLAIKLDDARERRAFYDAICRSVAAGIRRTA